MPARITTYGELWPERAKKYPDKAEWIYIYVPRGRRPIRRAIGPDRRLIKESTDISQWIHIPTSILHKCWLGGNSQKHLTKLLDTKAIHFPPISRKPPMSVMGQKQTLARPRGMSA